MLPVEIAAGSTLILSARRKAGFTIRQLAKITGIDETKIRKWERNLSIPDCESLMVLSRTLQIPHKILFDSVNINHCKSTPGEGYVTSKAGKGQLTERKLNPPKGKLKVFDLFCGCGGLSFGFEQSGYFVTTLGIDLLPDRIASFTANHPYATAISGDLMSYSLDDIKKYAGTIDVLVGGPPCQGFSSIRPFRMLTEDDPRNTLVEKFVLIINRLKPKWFVFENVVGILRNNNGTRFHALLSGLKDAGYTISWKVINAALFGVPQYRERVVIVGNIEGVSFPWPEPTHEIEYNSMAGSRKEVMKTSRLFLPNLKPAVTIMDAIGDLPHVNPGEEVEIYSSEPVSDYQNLIRNGCNKLTLHKATKHSEKMLEIIKHSGENIYALPKGLVTSGFSSCYSRLSPNKPSTTLTVNFIHPASNRCIHPYQNRALTPREGARIQSFPDTFLFLGTTTQVVKQIGNAVPPIVGKNIALAIARTYR